jgi:hypothetical protein
LPALRESPQQTIETSPSDASGLLVSERNICSRTAREIPAARLFGISEVTYVIGFRDPQPRISVLAYNKARSLQRFSNPASETLKSRPPEKRVAILITVLAMDRYQNIRPADHGKTDSFVEVSAGNVCRSGCL